MQQLFVARDLVGIVDSPCMAGSHHTPSDPQKTYDEIMAKGRSVADAVKQHRHDQEVFAFARELSDNVIGGLGGGDLSSSGSGSKSRRLSFKGMGTKVATMVLGQAGEKALAPSGAAVVGQEFKAMKTL
jgi:hypothetical protein